MIIPSFIDKTNNTIVSYKGQLIYHLSFPIRECLFQNRKHCFHLSVICGILNTAFVLVKEDKKRMQKLLEYLFIGENYKINAQKRMLLFWGGGVFYYARTVMRFLIICPNMMP